LAAGGGAAGGAGRAGGAVETAVGFGTGRDAESGVRVGAAASVDAAGRFTAVEDTDVGFTAAMGRAAFGAVAEPAGRAGAEADPTADATAPALAGVAMGFVGAATARGAPLMDAGCDGVGFGLPAEGDENDWVCAAVAAEVDDVGDRTAAAAPVDSGCVVGAGVADLRSVVVALAVGATVVDDGAATGAVAAAAETAAGVGASPDASSDASMIGETQVPEYAESTGAVAHEPVASVSISAAAANGAGSSMAGGDLAGVAREPVVAVSGEVASRAFCEPLTLNVSSAAVGPLRTPLGESGAGAAGVLYVPLGESDPAAARALRTPLGESEAAAVGPLRTPLGESGAGAAGVLCVPLGESDPAAVGPLRTPLDESGAGMAGALCAPLGESDATAVGPLRTPVGESGAVGVEVLLRVLAEPADAGAAVLGVLLGESVAAAEGAFRVPVVSRPGVPRGFDAVAPAAGARGAGLAALAAGPVAFSGGTGAVAALGAVGLPLAPTEADSAGGMPKPAGETVFRASGKESAVVTAALAGVAGEAALGGAAEAADSAVPCGCFASLAAEPAAEGAPFPGSSVSSNSSNPSKSSESGSKGDFSVTAAEVPGIPAASASLNASARRSGSPAPSRLSGLIISSASSLGRACRDPVWAGPLDDEGAVPTGTQPSMGASTGRSVSGSKMGRDAASIISSLVDTSSNQINRPRNEHDQIPGRIYSSVGFHALRVSKQRRPVQAS
jgi:hypothetical protein